MDEHHLLWPAPPARTSLAPESVHVWKFPLQVPGGALNGFAKILAPAERRRADAFHFDRDRKRFLAGRGTVRTILGRYLGVPPGAVELTAGSHGKPLLTGPLARSGLQFNLAHCEELALLAVARGRVVGVDLERIRAWDGAEEMAAGFCSTRENAEFQSLPETEREAAFTRLWTRKEAWLKACGEGIGRLLERVEVTFRATEAARFIRLPEEAGALAQGWSLHELTPAPGFVAALAVQGTAAKLRRWQWQTNEQLDYACV